MELSVPPVVLDLGEVPGLGGVRLRPWRDDDYARQRRAPVHADVSYWTVPEFRGRGLAARAASLAARWAWSAHRLHRVELHHELSDGGSCRVAQKAGYELEGTLRRSYWTPGGWVDEHLHASVAPEA